MNCRPTLGLASGLRCHRCFPMTDQLLKLLQLCGLRTIADRQAVGPLRRGSARKLADFVARDAGLVADPTVVSRYFAELDRAHAQCARDSQTREKMASVQWQQHV